MDFQIGDKIGTATIGGIAGQQVRKPASVLADPDNDSEVRTTCGPEVRSCVLPLPPSTNRLWRSIRTAGKVRLLKSREYRDWMKAATPIAAMMGRVPSPVAVAITIHACYRGSDLDNRLKGILDCLREASVIENDNVSHVRQIGIGYNPEKIDGEPGARIQVWTLEN